MFISSRNYVVLLTILLWLQGCTLTKWKYDTETREVGKKQYFEVDQSVPSTKSLTDITVESNGMLKLTAIKFEKIKYLRGLKWSISLKRQRLLTLLV